MHLAHGLCTRCYHRNRRTGALVIYKCGEGQVLAARITAMRARALRAREISEELGITLPDFYNLVDALRKKGLLPT